MKRLLTALSLLLVMAMLVPMTAFAAVEDTGADISAVVTVDGDVYKMDDAPSVEELGDFDSYEILSGDETILEIEMLDNADAAVATGNGDNPNPDIDIVDEFDDPEPSGTEMPGGYYSARFDLPDTKKEVFLTGLTAEKVEEIKTKLILNFAAADDFDLEDLSFIDAEKTLTDTDGDEEMCWAGTISNMLTYTGWAAKAGFNSTDDVFEQLINDFEDKGHNQYYTLGWFFNGTNYLPTVNPDAAASVEGSGAYLTDYAYDQVSNSEDIYGDPAGALARLRGHLDDGDAIALSISLYYRTNGAYSNDHSITCWGYVVDHTYSEDDLRFNAGLFTTDSDSDWADGDRRDAPNTLHAESLFIDNNGKYNYYIDDNYLAELADYTYLKPYSDTLPKETDAAANRNKVTTPDVYISEAYLGTDMDADVTWLDKIQSNTQFYYSPVVYNMSDVSFSGSLKIETVVNGADDSVVFRRKVTTNTSLSPLGGMSLSKYLKRDAGLPAGDYTMTFSINWDKSITEAYYYNNTYSFGFKVRDSYIVGDVNGDGVVDILDATTIQRILADYEVSATEGYQERAILDGGEKTDITFATAIQRWLVDYEVAYPINQTALYDGLY